MAPHPSPPTLRPPADVHTALSTQQKAIAPLHKSTASRDAAMKTPIVLQLDSLIPSVHPKYSRDFLLHARSFSSSSPPASLLPLTKSVATSAPPRGKSGHEKQSIRRPPWWLRRRIAFQSKAHHVKRECRRQHVMSSAPRAVSRRLFRSWKRCVKAQSDQVGSGQSHIISGLPHDPSKASHHLRFFPPPTPLPPRPPKSSSSMKQQRTIRFCVTELFKKFIVNAPTTVPRAPKHFAPALPSLSVSSLRTLMSDPLLHLQK